MHSCIYGGDKTNVQKFYTEDAPKVSNPRFISKLLAAELAEDMTRIQGLYLGYWLQSWLRI